MTLLKASQSSVKFPKATQREIERVNRNIVLSEQKVKALKQEESSLSADLGKLITQKEQLGSKVKELIKEKAGLEKDLAKLIKDIEVGREKKGKAKSAVENAFTIEKEILSKLDEINNENANRQALLLERRDKIIEREKAVVKREEAITIKEDKLKAILIE